MKQESVSRLQNLSINMKKQPIKNNNIKQFLHQLSNEIDMKYNLVFGYMDMIF